MASNNDKSTLIKDQEKNTEYGSLENGHDDGKVLLIEKNKTIFRIFKLFGLYVIKYRNNKYEMSQGWYMFHRFMWFIWHLGWAVGGILIKTYVEQDSTNTINKWLMSSIFILVFIIVDPVQTIILRRSLEILPDLLNGKIKELERQATEVFHANYRKVGMFPWERKVRLITDARHKKLDKSDSHTKVYIMDRVYRWEPVITLIVVVLAFLVLFIYGFWLEAAWSKIKHEATMIVMCMYLVFPILSTWFCVVFIEYERQLYKVINGYISNDDVFKDSAKIKDISNYIDLMQELFKVLTDNFFKFIFGMNSLIFVVCGIYCMYELLDAFDDARKFFHSFEEIFYVIPLAMCCIHIFIFSKRSHDLLTGQHQKLRVRLKHILSEMLLALNVEDKQFKKAEMDYKWVDKIYKNLKDYPPQAEIYGGYKVNYQILVGMFLFIFSYARIFKKIFVEREVSDLPTTITPTEVFNPTTLIT